MTIQKQSKSRKSRRSLILETRARTPLNQRMRAAIKFSLGPSKRIFGGRFQDLEFWRTRILHEGFIIGGRDYGDPTLSSEQYGAC